MSNEPINTAQEAEIVERKNWFCVISKDTYGEYGVHDIQTNSAWSANPYGEEYAEVPDDMVPGILATGGYCKIVLSEDGAEVVSFTALEKPNIPKAEPEPSAQDDTDAMMVDHEYRLTLLELGVMGEV